MLKDAQQRSFEISDEERAAAQKAISAFDDFKKKLWAARQHDQRLLDVLSKNEDASPEKLYEIRHLLRRFQREVRDNYAALIMSFAGKRDARSNAVTEGYIHTLAPLEKDTITRQIKVALQDAVQQLTEIIEEFIEAFEDFGKPEQVKNIVNNSKKVDQLAQTIENIIDTQMKSHFEKNILKRKKTSEARGRIMRRARLARMLEA